MHKQIEDMTAPMLYIEMSMEGAGLGLVEVVVQARWQERGGTQGEKAEQGKGGGG
jgi:hypothetical protein